MTGLLAARPSTLVGMNWHDMVKQRQIAWAKRHGVELVGSVWVPGLPDDQQDLRGEKAYTKSIEANLFMPMLQSTRRDFLRGKGRELDAKIRAVHGSAALVVNVFDYFRSLGEVSLIAQACELPCADTDPVVPMEFEATFEVLPPGHEKAGLFKTPPHLDCAIYFEGTGVKAAAIESKFTEPFYSGKPPAPLKEVYLELTDVWKGFPEMRELAQALAMNLPVFRHLDAAQLIRHILGLTNWYGRDGFALLYLYYDCPLDEGKRHAEEVSMFQEVADREGVRFSSLTHQKLIHNLWRLAGVKHKEYVDYLEERYVLSQREL